MKTTERFTNAVTKLYNAFHNGKLNAFECTACAVGNICDNKTNWIDLLPFISSTNIFVIQRFTSSLKHNHTTEKSGYSLAELAMIEGLFMAAHEDGDETNIETQYEGLCAVVEYLCELDGIPNVMDYTCLFETENNQPKHALCLI